MNKSFLFVSSVVFFLITGCGCASNLKNTSAHNTAQIEHRKMQQAASELMVTLNTLTQQSNRIAIQGRTLTEEEIIFSEQVSLLNKRFEEWKNKVVEVPNKFQTSKKAADFLKEQEKQIARLEDIFRQAKELK